PASVSSSPAPRTSSRHDGRGSPSRSVLSPTGSPVCPAPGPVCPTRGPACPVPDSSSGRPLLAPRVQPFAGGASSGSGIRVGGGSESLGGVHLDGGGDEGLEVAVEHVVEVVGLVPGAMVGDAVL